MGLIKAALGSAGGVMADQWKEFFTCNAMSFDVLVTKGEKVVGGRSSNTKGTDNVITDGSIFTVADGQCAIITDQGQVVDICAVPGEYKYDASSEPSLFSGSLSESIPAVFKNIGKRFTYGGTAPKDQRIYYVNTKNIEGNKYGTPSPIPFRVVDNNVGLDIDISIRCNGEYSYKITNPILFYTNVCGNVNGSFERSSIESQLKSEFLTALQPAFAKISEMGIRYSALPGHATEIATAMNEVLSEKWGALRGIEIVSVGVNSATASPEDEQMIKELQRNAAFRNPTMAAAQLVGAQSAAMQSAAQNQSSGGAAMAFMGMNMASAAGGMNPQALFQMGQQQQMQQAPAQQTLAQQVTGWTCACGSTGNTGKFCAECGKPQPVQTEGWTCSCGAINKGKFCAECGSPKPAGVPQYKCDKCGWEPADKAHPPKFCPECGDPFDDGDLV